MSRTPGLLLTETELRKITLKEMNERVQRILEDEELSQEDCRAVMRHRRKVSNRIYARNSRSKKKKEVEWLEEENQRLWKRVTLLEEENRALQSKGSEGAGEETLLLFGNVYL